MEARMRVLLFAYAIFLAATHELSVEPLDTASKSPYRGELSNEPSLDSEVQVHTEGTFIDANNAADISASADRGINSASLRKVEKASIHLENDELSVAHDADRIAQPLGDLHGQGITDLNKHFTTLGALKLTNCTEILKSLPVSSYFDVIKGTFRTGVIGEHVKDAFPYLISTITRKVVYRGEPMTIENIPILDAPQALMYSLAALKDVDKTILALSKLIKDKTQEKLQIKSRAQGLIADYNANINDLLWSFKNFSSMHLDSAESTQLLLERVKAMDEKTALYESLAQEYGLLTLAKVKALEEKRSLRQNKRAASQARLYEMYVSHEEGLLADKQSYLTELETLRKERADIKQRAQEQELKLEFEMETQKLFSDLEQWHEEAEWKAKEAIRIATETEETQLNVIRAEGATASAATQVYLRTVITESQHILLSLFGDWQSVAVNGSIFVFMITTAIIIQELFAAGRYIMRKLSSRKLPIRIQRKVSSLEQSSRVLRLPLESDIIDVLVGFTQRLQMCASNVSSINTETRGLNILITGPSGCGQVEAAESVAYDSGHAYCMLSAEDLMRVGSHGPSLLSEFCLARSKAKRAFILVITNADTLVAPRGDAGVSLRERAIDRGAARSYLYTLLDIMKRPQGCLHIVLTVSSDIHSMNRRSDGLHDGASIDPALVDRLDGQMELTLPSLSIRESYLKLKLLERFQSFIKGTTSATESKSSASPILSKSSEDTHLSGACEDAEPVPETHVPSQDRSRTGRVRHSTSTHVRRNDNSVDKRRNKRTPRRQQLQQQQQSEASLSLSERLDALDAAIYKANEKQSKTESRGTWGQASLDVDVVCEACGMATEGWTLADLDKAIDRAHAAALGTREFQVNTSLVMAEVREMLMQS